jgi:hypothetical protein
MELRDVMVALGVTQFCCEFDVRGVQQQQMLGS